MNQLLMVLSKKYYYYRYFRDYYHRGRHMPKMNYNLDAHLSLFHYALSAARSRTL
jgi:hypothetical protein